MTFRAEESLEYILYILVAITVLGSYFALFILKGNHVGLMYILGCRACQRLVRISTYSLTALVLPYAAMMTYGGFVTETPADTWHQLSSMNRSAVNQQRCVSLTIVNSKEKGSIETMSLRMTISEVLVLFVTKRSRPSLSTTQSESNDDRNTQDEIGRAWRRSRQALS